MTILGRLGLTETVNYKPAAGEAVEIVACVDRAGIIAVQEGRAPECQVCVLNDADEGIDAANMDVGADGIDLPDRVGGTAVARGIQRIVSQDADFLTLAVM